MKILPVEELLPSRGMFLKLAEAIPTKVSIVDRDGYYHYVNMAFVEWLGIRESNIIGKKITDFLKQDDDPLKLLQRVAETGREVRSEVVLTHPDKTNRFVQYVVLPHEKAGLLYLIMRDDTAIRLSKANEAKYEALFDTAGEGVIVMDTKGEITAFNRTAEKQFGYKASEIIGKNINLLMPKQYRADHNAGVKRYLKTGHSNFVDDNMGVDVECLKKGGAIFPATISVASFIADGARYFTGIVRDITERKQHMLVMQQWNDDLEQELKRRARELDKIFNLSNDVLAVLNYDGYYTSVSPSAENMTGVPVEHAMREKIHFSRFAVNEDRAGLVEVLNNVMATGQTVHSYEFRIPNLADGSTRWTAWSATPVPEDRIIIVVGRDITVEKQREEALRQSQKMEAIGQLTGGIAHDFNNILMGITGSLEVVESRINQDAVCKKYVDAAMSSAKKAASLTQRLLAFSRRQPLAPVAINTNNLIETMLELIQRTIGPQIEIELDLKNGISSSYCDPNQLENSLLNLVLNSRDAMETGKIIISTKYVSGKSAGEYGIPRGDYICISVADNGSGMDADTRSRVFDPFFTTKPIGKGTGLGLSMLYGFVNQSGGHVHLESSPCVGTTISMFLPRSEKDAAVETKTETKPLVRQDAKRRRILVIEDEAIIRDLLEDTLTQQGYEVRSVSEGNAALAEISDLNNRIDLVVSDVGLPGLNGKQIAEMGRVVRPNLRTLFITGYAAGMTTRHDWLDEGMDLILKPFKMDVLVEKVAEMIE